MVLAKQKPDNNKNRRVAMATEILFNEMKLEIEAKARKC